MNIKYKVVVFICQHGFNQNRRMVIAKNGDGASAELIIINQQMAIPYCKNHVVTVFANPVSQIQATHTELLTRSAF